MTEAKVSLGRFLFYDTRLSVNGTIACATCHLQEHAFAESLPVSIGATGDVHPRSSMSLVNVAYAAVLTWANPNETILEHQLLTPMFGEEPVEMGLAGREQEVLRLLREDATYREAFRNAFPTQKDPYTLENLGKAIASFQRSIVSFGSPYDSYRYRDDEQAISEAAIRGEALFFSERLECFHCHGGLTFSDTETHTRKPIPESAFHNTGLYNIDGAGGYPATNRGVMAITLDPADMGRFKAPTLRNIAVTAPYFHDGSAATLEEVLDHYAAGGRRIGSGPNAGDGARSPLKSEFLRGFALSSQDREDLVAFLSSLTDPSVLTHEDLSDPWPGVKGGDPRPRSHRR